MVNLGYTPNGVMWRLRWTDAEGVFMNVLHMDYTTAGPLNPGIADSMLNDLLGIAATTTWLSHLPTSVALIGLDVRDLRAANNPLISSAVVNHPGTAVGNALPPQTSMVITLRTAFAGRSFRGRVYLGGLSVNCSDSNGKIVGQANTDANAFVQNFGTVCTAVGGKWAILQRYLPPRTNHAGEDLPERQSAVVDITNTAARDNIFDTQRRRTGAHIGSR